MEGQISMPPLCCFVWYVYILSEDNIDRRDRDGEIFIEQDQRIAAQLATNEIAVVDAPNVKPEARQRLLAIARK
jgi:predicted kinase